MKKILITTLVLTLSISTFGQIEHGTWRTTNGNTDYHHFVRTGIGAAVYVNQASSNPSHQILRLSSGTDTPNQNVRFTVENNGFVGLGTTSPGTTLDVRHGQDGGISVKRTSMNNAIGKGLYITGGGYTNDADWGGISAGVSHDLGTYTARSDAASGIEFKNGHIYLKAVNGLTDGQFQIQFPSRLTIKPNGNIDINSHMYIGTNQLQFLSASGGNNRIHSHGGSNSGTWLFKSRFDNIVFEAGENDSNKRQIIFKIGNTERARLNTNGALGIGTTSTGPHKLAVHGSIGAREIKVQASGWSDFVFKNDYELRTLEEVEEHIANKGHLPEIPSAAEVTENGINLGEMDAKLLQKIEELTLYLIQQNKEIMELKELAQQQQTEIELLSNK